MNVKSMLLSGITLAAFGMALVLSPCSASAQMTPGMKMGQGKGAGMPPACQEMMTMRQSMRAEQASADAKLNDLVAKMNAASSEQKVDAIAAVVSQMVAQRQARHEKMAAMRGKMEAAMANCPMMRKGAGPAKPAKKTE
jgi:Na+-transporting methylmalonyl-CoA/oxaloacetate decarboxylase gamma subunit